MKSLSHVQLFAIPRIVIYQAPPSMGFSRQEYWSGLPFPSPGIFPTQGSNPGIPRCKQTLHPLSHQGRSKDTRHDPNRSLFAFTPDSLPPIQDKFPGLNGSTLRTLAFVTQERTLKVMTWNLQNWGHILALPCVISSGI